MTGTLKKIILQNVKVKAVVDPVGNIKTHEHDNVDGPRDEPPGLGRHDLDPSLLLLRTLISTHKIQI